KSAEPFVLPPGPAIPEAAAADHGWGVPPPVTVYSIRHPLLFPSDEDHLRVHSSSKMQCSAAKEMATAAPSSNISVGGRRTISCPACQSTMYWMKSPWNSRWRILPAAALGAPFGGPAARSI